MIFGGKEKLLCTNTPWPMFMLRAFKDHQLNAKAITTYSHRLIMFTNAVFVEFCKCPSNLMRPLVEHLSLITFLFVGSASEYSYFEGTLYKSYR